MATTITISSKKYRHLPCEQNAGHYDGVHKPRIIHYQATHWAVISNTGRPILRPAEYSDYAAATLFAMNDKSKSVQDAINKTRQY